MTDLSNVKKGDTIFVANSDSRLHHHREYEVVVRSVGPKWITTEGGDKFDVRSGHGEYGYSAYRSKQAYEDAKALDVAWGQLRAFVGYSVPATVTCPEQIDRALRTLRGEEEQGR